MMDHIFLQKIRRRFFNLLSLLLLSQTLFAASPDLKIGTLIFNPPFETSDAKRNVYTGFEIDVMSTVCQRLKLNCRFIPVATVQDVFQQLAANQFDIAVASVIVLKGDGEHVFSTPYLPSGIQFFAKKNNSKVNKLPDVLNSRIGTTNDPLVRTLVTVNYAIKYPLKIYPSPEAGIAALNSGEIDTFVMQTATTKYWLANTSGTFKAIGRPIPIGLGNGAVGMLTASGLMDQINQVLLDMQQDGTYVQIYNRYVLS